MKRITPMLATLLCGLGLACGTPSRTEALAPPYASTLQEYFDQLAGQWTGSYSLWLHPGSEAHESRTAAEVRSAPVGSVAWLDYTWKWKGEDQAGIFLLHGGGVDATASWNDSWHMSSEPMECTGELQDDGRRLVLQGSYPAGPGQPDWGWRTEFTLRGPDDLLMEAYNITPEGQEALAVRAEWTR